MRRLSLSLVESQVKSLVERCCVDLSADLLDGLEKRRGGEPCPWAENTLASLLENARVASRERIPLCQDTGMAVFFVLLGDDLLFERDNGTKGLEETLQRAMRDAYRESSFRTSMVMDPLRRKNTGDNSPAFVHWEFLPGDSLTISFIAKGGGAENMSRLKMFTPACSAEEIEAWIVETVVQAGSNPCPPTVVGVGLGGNFDTVSWLAKRALLRTPLEAANLDPFYGGMEERLLKKINGTGIGPQGLGGETTSLAVHVEAAPCHMATLPAAVKINCHAHRVGRVVL